MTMVRLGILSIMLSLIAGCMAGKEKTGREYAPQMYHSVPYEPLSQITDTTTGRWLTSRSEGPGEFYNSNPFNYRSMTMREPVPGTVPRNYMQQRPELPYRLTKDELEVAASNLKNPIDSTQAVLAEGKVLYSRFCSHCHGAQGQGDGLVGKVYKGVSAYTSRAVQHVSAGHIFHVITHGKGRMRAHGSQLSVVERWKIVRYVQTLQKQ